MPKLLTRNGRLILLASGRAAEKVDGETCGCCSTTTCTVCGPIDDFAALDCPVRSGIIATIEGVLLKDDYADGSSGSAVAWDGGSTISGDFCLYGGVDCGRSYSSLTPIKTGVTTATGNPDYVGKPVELYLYVRFICGGDVTNADEPIGPDHGTPYVEAYITALAPDNGGGGPVYLVAFSTEKTPSGSTFIEWDRMSCDLSGYAMTNACTTYSLGNVLDTFYTVGKSGSVTTGAACTNAPCTSGCATTGATADFTDGPMDGLSLDFDGDAATCTYGGDDGRYHGTIGPDADIGPATGYTFRPGFRMIVRDRSIGDAVVFSGLLACDGLADPAMGTYRDETVSGAPRTAVLG